MAMNPFKPTAGKMPPILIGRETAIEEFTEGLDNGAGAPGRIMLVTGQRGFGKTVLLTEFRRIAAERGWETISETASPDVAQRLIEALTPSGLHINQASVSPSVSIPGIASASLDQRSIICTAEALFFRIFMSLLQDRTAKNLRRLHGNKAATVQGLQPLRFRRLRIFSKFHRILYRHGINSRISSLHDGDGIIKPLGAGHGARPVVNHDDVAILGSQ